MRVPRVHETVWPLFETVTAVRYCNRPVVHWKHEFRMIIREGHATNFPTVVAAVKFVPLWIGLAVTGHVSVPEIPNEVPRGEQEEEHNEQKSTSGDGSGER